MAPPQPKLNIVTTPFPSGNGQESKGTGMENWYCSRDDVKRALDAKETARNNAQIDRAIESASRTVESLTHRKFYPEVATRYFSWPSQQYNRPWRLWLDADELISVTSITSGGVTISAANYYLEPANSGPPYSQVQINLGGTGSFETGSTAQRDIVIVGTYGYNDETDDAGALNGSLTDTTTLVIVTDSSLCSVGDILVCGSERMRVTTQDWTSTGQTTTGSMTAAVNSNSFAVADGSALHTDEVVMLDSEKMLITDITGNTITVKRSWDGSTLAAHNGGTAVYAPRSLTVERGVLGTTAATHADAASLSKQVVPSLVRNLVVAEAIKQIVTENTAGSSAGPNTDSLRNDVYAQYGRKNRMRGV